MKKLAIHNNAVSLRDIVNHRNDADGSILTSRILIAISLAFTLIILTDIVYNLTGTINPVLVAKLAFKFPMIFFKATCIPLIAFALVFIWLFFDIINAKNERVYCNRIIDILMLDISLTAGKELDKKMSAKELYDAITAPTPRIKQLKG